jgi:hypothetical protein
VAWSLCIGAGWCLQQADVWPLQLVYLKAQVAFRQALDRVAGVREPDAAAKHARNRGRLGEV